MLCVDIWPGAGETAVLAYVQLLTALTISVVGWLPMHLGKMCFQRAALRKCFPASSAAEWADPCTDMWKGKGQTGQWPPDQRQLTLPSMSIFSFLLQVLQTPPPTSHHLQTSAQRKHGPDSCVSVLTACSFPWGRVWRVLSFAPFNLGPESCNQYLSSFYIPLQAPSTAHRCESSCGA